MQAQHWLSPIVVALVGACAGCWLAASVSVAVPVAVAVSVGAVAATFGRGGGRLRVLVVWIVLGFGLAAIAHGRVSAAAPAAATAVEIEGIVGSDLANGAQVVRVPQGRVRVVGLQAPIPLGARVSVRGTARPPPDDPVIARRLHYRRVAADVTGAQVVLLRDPPVLLAAANAVRNRLHNNATEALGDERGGVLLGLLDGDDSSLPEETVEEFRRGGLSHLLVVSGSNLGFVLGAAAFVLGRLPLSRRARLLVAALLVVFYVLVTRAEPSVMRAAAMFGTALAVAWFGELRDPVRVFAAAVLALVVCDPFLAASAGFQLSVAATAGILGLAGPLAARLARLRVPRPVAAAVAVSTAAQVAVAPVLIWQFGRISAVGLVANLVAVPLAGGLTVAGAAAAVLTWWWPAVFAVLGPPVGVLVGIGSLAARMPGADMEVPRAALPAAAIAVAFCLVVLRLRARARAGRVLVAAGAAVVLGVSAVVWGASTASPCAGMAFVDVGQGDATLLVGRDGASMLVDTGRDPARLDRGLRSLGERDLDVLVLTHGDSDHVAAVESVLQRHRPALVVEPEGITWPSGTSRDAQRSIEVSGVVVRTVSSGDVVTAGDIRLRVLHPDGATTVREANDVAVVAVAEVAGLRVLLPSDASAAVQRRVLGRVGDVDVAKVPHHGSRDQEAALAAEAHAEIAVVPVGPNSYGHPTKQALDIYRLPGASEYRTDESGTVQVCADGPQGEVDVRTSR
ncbi:MAG: ComEC/Rec2 family competence protein [Acidimicrobiia bacterium]|nr:ComEC/Rec2 family competence protein [Acidimicrobiia bacterium]